MWLKIILKVTIGIGCGNHSTLTRSSESDGRSDVTDCFDLPFVLIALIGLDCPDCPDWFRLP